MLAWNCLLEKAQTFDPSAGLVTTNPGGGEDDHSRVKMTRVKKFPTMIQHQENDPGNINPYGRGSHSERPRVGRRV